MSQCQRQFQAGDAVGPYQRFLCWDPPLLMSFPTWVGEGFSFSRACQSCQPNILLRVRRTKFQDVPGGKQRSELRHSVCQTLPPSTFNATQVSDHVIRRACHDMMLSGKPHIWSSTFRSSSRSLVTEFSDSIHPPFQIRDVDAI
jgi:hypothetical protein